MSKHSAKFCGQCGKAWSYSAAAHGTPWNAQQGADTWERRPKSPRRKSPRHQANKGAGKAQDKGAQRPWHPKGKGKPTAQAEGSDAGGKGKPSYADVVKPNAENLPKPPAAVPIVTPKATGQATAAPSAERAQLEALLKTLGPIKETLPAETLELYEKYQLAEAQDNSKELHKAVALQANSKRGS